MKIYFRFFIFLTILFTISCTKESIKSTKISDEGSIVTAECVNPWTGNYADGIHSDSAVKQIAFIKDGVATLTPINWSDYHTGIYYSIPICHYVPGDTMRFDAMIKNPNNTAGAFSNYDVAMQIYGSKSFSEVNFVASSSFSQYNHIWIGNSKQSNLPELVHYFGDYSILSVKFYNKTLSIYINNILIKTIPYDITNKLGRLQKIGCGFKGTGTIDWIKLYNSQTKALLMKENFNLVGKGNVIWYQ